MESFLRPPTGRTFPYTAAPDRIATGAPCSLWKWISYHIIWILANISIHPWALSQFSKWPFCWHAHTWNSQFWRTALRLSQPVQFQDQGLSLWCNWSIRQNKSGACCSACGSSIMHKRCTDRKLLVKHDTCKSATLPFSAAQRGVITPPLQFRSGFAFQPASWCDRNGTELSADVEWLTLITSRCLLRANIYRVEPIAICTGKPSTGLLSVAFLTFQMNNGKK